MPDPRTAAAALLAAAALPLAGCGSGGHDPYAGQLRQAKASASTPFEQAVLADGKITHAEYQESLERQIACLKAHGFATVKLYNQLDTGIFALEYPTPKDQAGLDRVKNACATGTSRVVADLYVRMTTNPKNVDPDQVMVDCLHRLGLAPGSFTAQDYRTFVTTHSAVPFDPNDVRFSECSVDPAKAW